MRPLVFASAAAAAVALSVCAAAQRALESAARLGGPLASAEPEFDRGAVEVDGHRYGYRLLRPLPRWRATPQPIVVFLHGAGERGDDNRSQLRWLPELLGQPALRVQRPCYVLAVQCPADERWVDVDWGDAVGSPMAPRPTRALAAVERALAAVLAEPGVDPARIYVTGLSMGGFGAWELAARGPDRFAALLPVCGGGDLAAVPRLLAMPIQVWHGADDPVVPVERSRAMVGRLRELGAAVDYRELPGVGHDAWRDAYGGDGGLEWLFAQDQRQQRRGAFAEPAIVPLPDVVARTDGVFQLAPGARCCIGDGARVPASYFVAALGAAAVADVPLVRGDAAPGDIALRIEPDLPVFYELTIDDRVTLRARHAAALGHGLAALWQALHTWPDRQLPTGTIVRRNPPVRGRLAIGPGPAAWSHLALQALLRECWLYGVDEICFDVGARELADRRDWRAFEATAAQLGVAIVAGARAATGPQLEADDRDTIGTVLQREVPGADGPVPFELQLRRGGPDGMLAGARRLLPAVAERAQRPDRPVHVGSLRARAAARWR